MLVTNSAVVHDDIHFVILTDFVAGRRACGRRRPLIVVGRNDRPPDLQQRVHREPLGVFGCVLVLGSAVPADGGALFAEHVQDETTFETHAKKNRYSHRVYSPRYDRKTEM